MATQIATIEPRQELSAAAHSENERFNLLQRKAALFASSPLIPETLRAGGQQQALANCYIGLTMAEAMGENPLTVLQNIHVVKGKAGFSAQFMIARANASGVFADRIDWRIEGQGDKLSVTAFACLAKSGQEVSVTCDMNMAKAEGWTSNPKYKSMPEVMLRYRSATFLVRFYAPDVMFGYQTAEEVEDVSYVGAPSIEAKPLTASALIEQSQIEVPPQPTEPAPEAEAAGPATSSEPVAGDSGLMSLEEAKREIDSAETVIDVNARKARLIGQLSDGDGDALVAYAEERVDHLKGRR